MQEDDDHRYPVLPDFLSFPYIIKLYNNRKLTDTTIPHGR
jgi:hypothetical protein